MSDRNPATTGLQLTVVDAGARYGLHPSWAELQSLADFHLFEIDADEVARLRRKYANRPNVTIHPTALYSHATTLTFSLRKHRGLNSILPPNDALLARDRYKQEEHQIIGRVSVEARTIDELFAGQSVHFLKLDTEGTELDILKGAVEVLERSVLAVRCEVSFIPILAGGPLFGDIHRFLLDHEFELLNLDYDGRGSPAGPFTLPQRFGKLMSSDGVWLRRRDRLFFGDGRRRTENAVALGLFLMLNHATDVAIDVLLQAVSQEGVDLAGTKADPLGRALNRKIMLFFKELTYLPQLPPERVREAYRTLYRDEFPDLNRFYESDLFE